MGEPARCTYCRRLLRSTAPGRPTRTLTRDHILPRAWGRSVPGVRNTRPSCERCNRLRAACGHCPAVLALALHFAPRHHGSPDAARRWLIGRAHG